MNNSVYLIIQTRNVPSTDYVLAVCATRKLAEEWIVNNCGLYGECISPFTGNFIKPKNYLEYFEGKCMYYYNKNKEPCIIIQEYKFVK